MAAFLDKHNSRLCAMHRHVAQRTAAYAKDGSLFGRTGASYVLLGPPIPSELLLLTTPCHAFSTCSRTRGRRSSKLATAIPKLANISSTTTSTPPSQIEEPFRRLEKYLQAPYPRDLVPIQNDLLRNEVFRPSRPNGQSVFPELPQAYYHTALEKKGDDLTRLIADEVAIYWCLQFSEDYTQAAKFLNKHSYHPVSALVRNTHWTVLSLQFAVHAAKFDSSGSFSTASRLADNWEAYIYALYLDQGLEKVYTFLCPIFLKKLYSQARQLQIPIPSERKLLELQDDGTFAQPRFLSRMKDTLTNIVTLNKPRPAKIRRIEYKGLVLPDWEVPCTNGKDCRRDDCYFDHNGEALERTPLFTPSASSGLLASPKPKDSGISDMPQSKAPRAEAVEATRPVTKVNIDAVASTQPIQRVQLENGIFKRIETLINNKFERMKGDFRAYLEDLVKNGLKLELQAERKQDQKEVLAAVLGMLDEDSKNLPSKMERGKTNSIADKASDKIVKRYDEAGEPTAQRLAVLEVNYTMLEDGIRIPSLEKIKIEELEARIAALEKALAERMEC